MNSSRENQTLSFERVLFFSDAVIAIVITLLVLEIKVPHLNTSRPLESDLRHTLVELIPKVLGFVYSFFIIGMLWIEHHRIFRFIGNFDFGLIWRNLLVLLFIAFIPFPTALFSEYFFSQTAFVLYVASFAFAALAKIWLWSHAVRNRQTLLIPDIDDEMVKRISRRSWAVPIVCGIAIIFSFISNAVAVVSFPLIPLIAHFLYPNKKAASVAADK